VAPIEQAVQDYYRAVAPVLLAHLARRPVSCVTADGVTGAAAPRSAPELLRAVADGVLGFAGPSPDRVVLQLVPGAGADIATAATAALALAEQLVADGLSPVPLTDGSGGLLLMASTVGDPFAAAARYAAVLTAAAPELATADPGQADGRSLVVVPGPSDSLPVPYSLVGTPDGPQPVIPLHLDEIAAITAGMPADITADDVPDRIAQRGDLASALLGDPTA
jgi:bifunctional non-homologous end joining protein LigD